MCASKKLARIAVLATLLATAAPVSADTAPPYFAGTPYNDPLTGHAWTGQSAFQDNSLQGYVNWIVYAPDPGSFPYSGYNPTDGEFTYVYQVFSTGTDPIHGLSVPLDQEADNIGAFGSSSSSIPWVVPSAATVMYVGGELDSALWQFLDNKAGAIGQGQASQMLAFSSTESPEALLGLVFDGGNSESIAVSAPGGMVSIAAPEPSTFCLTLIGLAMGAAAWVVRRRRGRNGL